MKNGETDKKGLTEAVEHHSGKPYTSYYWKYLARDLFEVKAFL